MPSPRLSALSALILLALPCALAAAPVPIPESLRDIVMGGRHRPVHRVSLNGGLFDSITPFSTTPYLLWPVEQASASPAARALPYDPLLAAGWLRQAGGMLGLGPFELRFEEVFSWRDNEVWAFGLKHQGTAVLDARIMLHWRDGKLIGIVNAVPQPIGVIDPAPPADSVEGIYVAQRGDAGYRLRLAQPDRRRSNGRNEIRLVAGGEVLRTIVMADPAPAASLLATFREWDVPGVFPDQIDIDNTGIVWFSQPSNTAVTSFDPTSQLFVQYPTTGGNSPDGMLVDRKGILWTGMYDGVSGLGRFDTDSKVFSLHGAPYPGPIMAVPTETSRDTIWMTDHEVNKISEYDPSTNLWLQSFDVPTPAAWVVSGTEDPITQDIYFTEYAIDSLLLRGLSGPMSEIATPAGGGPAFDGYYNGKVYFSQWITNRLGVYDIASRTVTEFAFPVTNEPGGPMCVTPGGLVAVGTRNVGYVMVFDPVTETFASYQVPTPGSGFKDGMQSDVAGNIWFTESGASKIGVLELCATPPPALGNVLVAVREGATGALLQWLDSPTADGYDAASAETRDLGSLVVFASAPSGTPGILDPNAVGASGIRGYRVATTLCGSRSGF